MLDVSKLFLQLEGEVSYNGFGLEEFVPEKTSAYISQYDLHIPEMTVRETLDFSARFQGVGSRAGKFLKCPPECLPESSNNLISSKKI